MSARSRVQLRASQGLSYIAFWQLITFVLLILMVWVDQVLDLSNLLFDTPAQRPNVYQGCLATAGVLLAAAVTVGNTYLQQRRIIRGMLTICSYCKRIRIENQIWQQIEEFIGRRSTIDFTHSVCPECFQKVKESMEPETASDRSR